MVARIKYVMGGSLQGAETWSMGFHAVYPTLADPTLYQQALNALAASVKGNLFGVSNGTYFGVDTTFDVCQAYQYNAAGVLDLVLAADGAVWHGAGLSDAEMPTECAVVASLRTALPTRRGRGRMYLAGMSTTALAANGRVDAVFCQNMADAVAEFIMSPSTVTGAEQILPVVYSAVADLTHLVTEVQVGDVWDAQRRRRDALVEARYSSFIT